jgi:hypothetical protein
MKKLIDEIATAMMVSRGWKPGEWEMEWDPKNRDSQYYMVREDVEFVVNFLKKTGNLKK